MLSKLEYIAQMSRYDREKLQEYQDAVDLISEAPRSFRRMRRY